MVLKLFNLYVNNGNNQGQRATKVLGVNTLFWKGLNILLKAVDQGETAEGSLPKYPVAPAAAAHASVLAAAAAAPDITVLIQEDVKG
jgi:hypothetical protein